MPEGVEVKISAELIKPLVIGKTTEIFCLYGRYGKKNPEGFNNLPRKLKVLDVNTKGKFMYWTFEDDWYMYCTFGMSGQWSPTQGKHPAFGIVFSDSSEVFFNDPRHFGTIKFVHGKENLMAKLRELGWDPLVRSAEEYDAFVHDRIHTSIKPIGDLLMDQGVFAGVGNYIRAEALYLAKISPHRRCYTLTADDIDRLQQALVDVMKESYQHQGATILTYKDAYGAEGKYSSCFKVYGQKNDPLGNKIKKETMPGGRTIHWSPAVQI